MEKKTLDKANAIQAAIENLDSDIRTLAESRDSRCGETIPEVVAVIVDYKGLYNSSEKVRVEDYPELQQAIKDLVLKYLQDRKADLEAQFAAL